MTKKLLNLGERKDSLIEDLIFSKKETFEIDISEYVEDIYDYELFVSEMEQILKKSEVKIIKSKVELNSKTALWKLRVNK
ncbi:hypothetical protein [Flavobacteriaceae bacterium 14752]|uniref:hypothetical protein n=1 Tax=Mesohalobacter salilacus TaxID=2491711 RepID=UPI000F63C149|nr:hypothetical protein EIG84_12255 [Flavobacteriaceae bacterium 14752]